MGLLSLVSFVKVCVDDGKEDGESLVLLLRLFELFESVSSSLCSNGQIKGLSSSFGLSVNHKKTPQSSLVSGRCKVIFNPLDSGLADVVLQCSRTRKPNPRVLPLILF